MNACTLKTAHSPSSEQSTNPAAPQSYLNTETAWDEIQGFPEGMVY